MFILTVFTLLSCHSSMHSYLFHVDYCTEKDMFDPGMAVSFHIGKAT